MQCPSCNAQNEAGSQFCISCGSSLAATGRVGGERRRSGGSQVEMHRRLLGIATARFAIGLFLLYVAYLVVVNLNVVETLIIPDMPFSVVSLLRALTFAGALVLLLLYAGQLRALWPRAFPRLAALTPMLTGLIFVLAISAGFTALRVPLVAYVDDPDIRLVFQLILALLAVAILTTAWLRIYAVLPGWLGSMRFDLSLQGGQQVACLKCGRLNSVDQSFCGQCGSSLDTAESAGS